MQNDLPPKKETQPQPIMDEKFLAQLPQQPGAVQLIAILRATHGKQFFHNETAEAVGPLSRGTQTAKGVAGKPNEPIIG